jgi:hypothetical protein
VGLVKSPTILHGINMDKFLFLYRHRASKDFEYQKLTPEEFQDKLYMVSSKASPIIHILLRNRIYTKFGHSFIIKLK